MARIKLQNENAKDPLTQEVFSEIKAKVGRVPAAYRAFALHPHILQANWNRTKNILGKGNIPLGMKEAIATRVSTANGCHFCVAIHRQNMAKCGFSEHEIKDVERNKGIKDKRLAFVLRFVTIATRNPQKLTNSDFSKMRTFGFSDKDIVEILTAMEMYTGYNKIIVALDLKLDD